MKKIKKNSKKRKKSFDIKNKKWYSIRAVADEVSNKNNEKKFFKKIKKFKKSCKKCLTKANGLWYDIQAVAARG